MSNVKKIAFWTIWIIGIIIKLLFAVASALIQYIEFGYTKLQLLFAKWYGEEWVNQAADEGVERLAKSYESMADLYREMKIEL
jgi:hypothetical protein